MAFAQQLAEAISKACPIDGVSIGRLDNRDTWRVDFRPEATAEQRAAAPALVAAASFDLLADFKAGLKTRIDDKAEAIRQRYLTGGAGQAQEYIEARAEAAAVLALPDPGQATAEQFPMLAASIGVSGGTIAAVAQTIMATYAAWKGIGARIRQVRLAGKAAIDAAPSVEAAQAAFDAIVWP